MTKEFSFDILDKLSQGKAKGTKKKTKDFQKSFKKVLTKELADGKIKFLTESGTQVSTGSQKDLEN